MLSNLFRKLFFQKKKTFLAFEYGLVLAEVAMKQGVELTPELVEKAERMIEGEFQKNGVSRLAVDIVPNIMSVFELDLNK